MPLRASAAFFLPRAVAPVPQLVRLNHIVRGRVRGGLAGVLAAHGVISGARDA